MSYKLIEAVIENEMPPHGNGSHATLNIISLDTMAGVEYFTSACKGDFIVLSDSGKLVCYREDGNRYNAQAEPMEGS